MPLNDSVTSIALQSLGADYSDSVHRRMAGRYDRRAQYSEIDTKSVERFGHLCSPFQALQVVVSEVLCFELLEEGCWSAVS